MDFVASVVPGLLVALFGFLSFRTGVTPRRVILLSLRARKLSRRSGNSRLTGSLVGVKFPSEANSAAGYATMRYSMTDPLAVHVWVSAGVDVARYRFARDLFRDALLFGGAGEGRVRVETRTGGWSKRGGSVEVTVAEGDSNVVVVFPRKAVERGVKDWWRLVPDIDALDLTAAVDDALARLLPV